MRIGLLAYHSACNFGATLQLLSTYMYLKNHGHTPMIINWVAPSLEALYSRTTPAAQYEMQKKVRQMLWHETALCHTTEEVAQVVVAEGFDAVIIGSDAVAQHHSFLERLTFPCRTIIGVRGFTADTQFPNPFWADWLPLLKHPIPVAAMSVSNQDSSFRLFPKHIKEGMRQCIKRYAYLSVRDDWTQQMFYYLTKGACQPVVTPDPVFAFNQNACSLLPTKQELKERFHLPDNYIIVSFLPSRHPSVSQAWLDDFSQQAASAGYTCVMLPFSQKASFGTLPHSIPLPLSPVDWYALIKYASAYVGNNMHPIIVSIHNQVPFFSFDTYGTSHLNGLYVSESSSKIRHILSAAGFLHHRVSSVSRSFTPPPAINVLQLLRQFDVARCQAFATECLERYNAMMNDLLNSLSR